MTAKIESLGRVVGRNVRRLRRQQDLSLDDVARAARIRDFDWSASRVNAIQRGERNPKLSTLLVLTNVLECSVADLLQTSADLVNLEEVLVPADQLAAIFSGAAPPVGPSKPVSKTEWVASRGFPNEAAMTAALGVPAATLRDMSRRCGLTETRTARALGMDTWTC